MQRLAGKRPLNVESYLSAIVKKKTVVSSSAERSSGIGYAHQDKLASLIGAHSSPMPCYGFIAGPSLRALMAPYEHASVYTV